METSSRYNEGALLIAQRNHDRTVQIVEMNGAAQQHLGLSSPLANHPLTSILGVATQELLEEELEYDIHGTDLLDLLSKQRTITLRHADGSEHPIGFNITRMMAQGREAIFRLILSPRTLNATRYFTDDIIHSHDEATGLPDSTAMITMLRQAQEVVRTREIDACFAYIQLDKSVQIYGSAQRTSLLAHCGRVIRRNLRGDDMVARMGDDALGILLMDVNMQSVHLALHRIHRMLLCDPPMDSKGHIIDIGTHYHAVLIDQREVRALIEDALTGLSLAHSA
ncbi:MAG: diguanylate cyclase [Alphaproteobacteria bacterium]|nr:MAG: diguanylate cyclase [Alphaproteobacteria bacterium]